MLVLEFNLVCYSLLNLVNNWVSGEIFVILTVILQVNLSSYRIESSKVDSKKLYQI